MNSIKLSNGKVFESYTDRTILDSALQHNIILEHSCRTGRCGVCKTRIVQGLTKLLQPEDSLSAKEMADGNILTCCRSANSDLILEAEDLGALSNHPPKISPCRIDSLRQVASNVMEVILRLPPNQPINYLPGQYIDLIGKGGVRRSYSIANAPRSDGRITLFIKKVKNGEMSYYWFNDAKVNDLLRLEGPLGTFIFREPAPRNIVMLATGTGIAPIKALLEQLDSDADLINNRRIFLIWGNRFEKEFFWKHEFENLDLIYIPVLSQADKHWKGDRGYVQEILIESEIDLKDVAVYACGSEDMINSAKAELAHAGLISHNFHADAFVCSS
ncbi:FAD-binding oxidoreductase [Vreelandella salicampi]|uniref:2Fe-2S iron-sulfur cluster binding domain-containing protein n=1 Tax=Vreelandella salicampi TaxID=1449798 RepID=A0A7Z0RTZ9_9GAMM|nr:FAD-binding oxidoreductase [Halomonas salicampi]NYS59725.1 2Fe-2S iron-sulfur cluster binding domain-containing protein [Halomonas salicampi]